MNIQKALFLLITFVSFNTFAQTEDMEIVETKATVSEMMIETDKIDQLTGFDWDRVYTLFKRNEQNDDITLSFTHKNPEKRDSKDIKVENFSFQFSGKTSELDDLIKQSKEMIEKLITKKEADQKQ